MPADAPMNTGEDDMSPLPGDADKAEDTSGSGEPDDSPGGDSLDVGKGHKNPNGTLAALGAGGSYRGTTQ